MKTLRVIRRATVLMVFLTAATSFASAQARNTKRIQFPPGSTTVVVKGTLKGPHDFTYIVSAKKGQTLVAHIAVEGDGQASLLIKGPGNRAQTNADGSDAADDFSIVLPSTGDYRIIVFPPEMTEPRDVARYTLEVTIR